MQNKHGRCQLCGRYSYVFILYGPWGCGWHCIWCAEEHEKEMASMLGYYRISYT